MCQNATGDKNRRRFVAYSTRLGMSLKLPIPGAPSRLRAALGCFVLCLAVFLMLPFDDEANAN